MIKFEEVSYTYQKNTPYEYQALNQISTEFYLDVIMRLSVKRGLASPH